MFEQIATDIYRLCIPFEDNYTSSFALIEGDSCIIIDSGSNASDEAMDDDSRTYLIPAIEQAGFKPTMLICSHLHSDHSGGMMALIEAYPEAEVCLMQPDYSFGNTRTHTLSDGELLYGRYQVLNLKGHTDDSIAVFDLRTKTLLTFDCIQLCGVSRYGTGISDSAAYRKSLKRVGNMDIDLLVTSHPYYPLGYIAVGKSEIERYLTESESALDRIIAFASAHTNLSPDEIARRFNAAHPDLPPIPSSTVRSLL
ncbi:MAG: MBL fold metallo-hydrolase [Clostridiales bacterium]|nr:MBL fold metallo-hydrolase [Clostridiales bacterium]